MKKTIKKHSVIVIGGEHHNILGVIRSLGIEKNINIIAIILSNKKYSYISKSKYLSKYYIVPEETTQIDTILKKYSNHKNKIAIIPTSDYAAHYLDKNYYWLSKSFFLPSINNTGGHIVELMNKYTQYELAKSNNISMANCKIIKLDKSSTIGNITYDHFPCILKPLASIDGEKSDIQICNDINAFHKIIDTIKGLGYSRILVQDYIDYDTECGLIGCIHNGKIILPGMIKKRRIYPQKRGNNSYSDIIFLPKNKEIKKIVDLLRKINFSGMFDIEIFIKNNTIYLNEINFRNSGNTFAYCYNKIFIANLWVKMVFNESIEKDKKVISNEFSYIDEYLERKQLFAKNISLFEFIKTRLKTKAKLFGYKNDPKVSIYKIIYAFRKRLLKD